MSAGLAPIVRRRAAIADYDTLLKHMPDKASSLFGRGEAKKKAGDGAGGENDIAAADKSLNPSLLQST